MAIFSNQKTATHGKAAALIQALDQSGATKRLDKSVTSLALESANLSQDNLQAIQTAESSIEASLMAMFQNNANLGKFDNASLEAASVAGIIGADWKAAVKHSFKFSPVDGQNVVEGLGGDSFNQRTHSLEAYDETENRNVQLFSMAYNLLSSRLDDFGAAFWPTITIPSDQTGISVTVDRMVVYDAILRRVDGSTPNWVRKNLLRAYVDPSIMKNDQTRLYPVFRDGENDDMFVDPALVPAQVVKVGNESITTQYLKAGTDIEDLIGLTQTDALLAAGTMDQTDSIDPGVRLDKVLFQFGADVIEFDAQGFKAPQFLRAPQGNYKDMQLNIYDDNLVLHGDLKTVGGGELQALALLKNNNLSVRVRVAMNGELNLELGRHFVDGKLRSVMVVEKGAGTPEAVQLAKGDADFDAIVDILKTGKIIGYKLFGYRSNLNRRQNGQFIDVTKEVQTWTVPMRAPINTIHPASSDETDATDVQRLVTATNIQTSNAAVTYLLEARDTFRQFRDVRDAEGEAPAIFGHGRHYVRPVFVEDEFDVTKVTDSVQSHKRDADVSAAARGVLRDHVYNVYVQSEYKAAAMALGLGTPKVIIGTDPITARYLDINGELRRLGADFDVQIVHTLDKRMRGQIIIVFGVDEAIAQGQPHPLNFGNFLWAPDLVLTANITRNGQHSRETVIQPRYSFIVNCPIMISLTVKGWTEAFNQKVPLHMLTLNEEVVEAPVEPTPPVDGGGTNP